MLVTPRIGQLQRRPKVEHVPSYETLISADQLAQSKAASLTPNIKRDI